MANQPSQSTVEKEGKKFLTDLGQEYDQFEDKLKFNFSVNVYDALREIGILDDIWKTYSNTKHQKKNVEGALENTTNDIRDVVEAVKFNLVDLPEQKVERLKTELETDIASFLGPELTSIARSNDPEEALKTNISNRLGEIPNPLEGVKDRTIDSILSSFPHLENTAKGIAFKYSNGGLDVSATDDDYSAIYQNDGFTASLDDRTGANLAYRKKFDLGNRGSLGVDFALNDLLELDAALAYEWEGKHGGKIKASYGGTPVRKRVDFPDEVFDARGNSIPGIDIDNKANIEFSFPLSFGQRKSSNSASVNPRTGLQEFNLKGKPSLGKVLDTIEDKGRNGDTELVHVTPGERILTQEMLDEDPEFKAIVDQKYAQYGIHPNQATVGTGDVNVETGLQEFNLDDTDPMEQFITHGSFSEVGQYPDTAQVLTDLPNTGYEFAPGQRFTEGFTTGAYTLSSNLNYMKSLWHSIRGNEDAMDEAIYEAELDRIQGASSQVISSGEIFHKFLDEPTFGGFIEASMGFMGEMGPSAAATITSALAGSALGALVTAGTGGGALAGVAGAGAVGTGGRLATSLALKGYTKKQIKESVKKALKKEKLTDDQIELMEAVYQNYRNKILTRNTRIGGLTGAAAQEYPQGAGTFFGNYAEQGMTDPMYAWMAAGKGVPFTAIGLGSEVVLYKTVTGIMGKKQAQRMSLLNPKPPKRSFLKDVGMGTAISSLSESIAELGQQELEIHQKFEIDDTYTKEQARLDRITSAFAGFAGGFGIGGTLSSTSSVVGLANDYLHENHVKTAVEKMFNLKQEGDPTGLVTREPKKWILAQFAAMFNPNNDKDAVWVDVNSAEQLVEAIPEIEEKYGKDGYTVIPVETAVGGFLITTNPEKAESFKNQLYGVVPSQSLMEDLLSKMLDYPRGRIATDEWVLEVRDGDGVPIHYHQTGDPNKEGAVHLEGAKALFRNNPEYTYEIVEGEKHLLERGKLISPFDYKTMSADKEEAMDIDYESTADPVLLARYKKLLQKAVAAGGLENLSPEDQQTLKLDFQALREQEANPKPKEGQLQKELEGVKEQLETDEDDAFNEGVLPQMQEVNLYNAQGMTVTTDGDLGSDTNPFLGRGGKPWAVPSGKYTNEFPTEEQIDDVLDLYPPGHPFREEFQNMLMQKQLSKSVVSQLIKLSGTEISNINQALRIEKAGVPGRTDTAFQITKWNVPIESAMDLTYNAEIGRIIRTALNPKSPPLPRWSLRRKNSESESGTPVHMPMLINKMQKYIEKTGMTTEVEYGTQLQDAIVTLFDMLGQEQSEFELLYDFKPPTEEVLRTEPIYMRGSQRNPEKGKKPEYFTFSELSNLNPDQQAANMTEEERLAELAKKEKELKDLNEVIDPIEERLEVMKKEQNPNADPVARKEQYNEFMSLVDQLYGPKYKDDKRNDPTKNLLMQRSALENQVAWLTDKERSKIGFDPRTDIEDTTDPIRGDEGDFQSSRNEQGTEKYWEAEHKAWLKQPLSKNTKVGKYSAKAGNPNRKSKYKSAPIRPLPPIIKKDTTIEVSETVDTHFGEEAGTIKTLVETARNILKIKKPLLIFSTNEVIDLGHEGMNTRIKEVQEEVAKKEGRKAKNVPMQDYDVVILDTQQGMPFDLQGLFIYTLGHEIGHSYLRQELSDSLTNPKLRAQLQKMYEKDKAKNPSISAWQGDKGFDEWFADKISGTLFDVDKGEVTKATNLAEAFIKRIVNKITQFFKALKNRLNRSPSEEQTTAVNNVLNRFAYNEAFAEAIKGLNTAQTEATNEQSPQEPSYQDRAHIEDMLDAAFGPDQTGHKVMRKAQSIANKILTTGKLPKGFRKLFETAHSHLERLGVKEGYVGSQIANFFHKLSGTPGAPGMINEANRLLNEVVNELLVLLGEEEYTSKVQDALNEAQDETKDTETLSENGQIVRNFIASLHDRFDLGSLGIIQRANFFPRIIAINAIAHDETKRQKLIELLVERNPGNTVAAATTVVDHLINKNHNNLEETTEDEKEFDVAVSKKRVKMFEALDTKTLVDEGLAETADIAFFEYVRKTTRRAEFEKRGGTKKLEELVNKLPKDEQAIAREAIDALLGRISPIKNDMWKKATSYGLLLNVVTLLSMAVFASIPDAAGPVLRARELNMSSISKNLYAALTAKEAAEFTKSVGSNAAESITSMALQAGEVEAMMPSAKKWSDNWFRWTQLERWTRFTRVFAAGMARDFLLKHAKNVKEGVPNSESVLRSMRYLRELGVTGADVDAWNGADVMAHPKIKTAVGRFVDEAIVRPNAAERPIWASDPHYALVWQLKSFYYAYGKNIIGGLFREGKALYGEKGNIPQSAVPLFMGAATLIPLTMLGWDLRERFKIGLAWLLPGISPNDPGVDYRQSQSMGSGEYWFDVMDRSGALGAYALAIPLFMEDKRYGNPFFVPIMGPTAEKGWDLVSGNFDATDYIPLYSQLNTSALTYRQ